MGKLEIYLDDQELATLEKLSGSTAPDVYVLHLIEQDIARSWVPISRRNVVKHRRPNVAIELARTVKGNRIVDQERFVRDVAWFVDHGRLGRERGSGKWWVGFKWALPEMNRFCRLINTYFGINAEIDPRPRHSKRTGAQQIWFKVHEAKDALKLLNRVKPYVTTKEQVERTIADCEKELAEV